MSEVLHFNGINGATGEYSLPPMTPEQLKAAIANEEKIDEGLLNELKSRRQARFAVKEGVDPRVVAQSGWGVIFAAKDEQVPAIKEAMSELLAHRQEQAGEYYYEYSGGKGYRPRESKLKWLGRHGAGPGPADPDVVPYYLLIVGGPEQIPYRFQTQLDVQYAVGRIHFDTLDEYARYARSVVEAESGRVSLARQAAFFGVRTRGDRATQMSADHLVAPLSKRMADDQSTWQVNTLLAEQATKARLSQLLGGDQTPALLFSASHGMGFPKGDSRQFPHQGALLCQDWPGPEEWREAIPEDFYFSADDIASDASLLGSMGFFFACYGAGTPRLDEFAKQAFKDRAEIAPHAFISNLPRRLLGHPKGGMLAVVGHVERAWGYSFMWDQAGKQLAVFESSLKRLLEDAPIGYAIEYFNERYAELASEVAAMVEDMEFNEPVDELELAGMWTANNDARGYVIVGDPAARLPVAPADGQATERPAIRPVEIKPAADEPVEAAGAAVETAPDEATPEMALEPGRAESFGLFGGDEEGEGLMASFRGVASDLAEALKQALDDVSSLEISTYTSDDLDGVKYDPASRKLSGRLQLRAFTHVSFDGDTQVCLPQKEDGKVDRELWQIHLEMVKEAQTNRAELIKTMADLAARLAGR